MDIDEEALMQEKGKYCGQPRTKIFHSKEGAERGKKSRL